MARPVRTNFDRGLTIRGRLYLLLLALAVPFSGYLGISTWRQAHEERENMRQQMLASARLTAAKLDDHVGDIRQLLSVLAEVADPRQEALDANGALLSKLAARLPPQINNLSVWTRDGELAGTLDQRLRDRAPNFARRKFFLDAMNGADLAIEAPVTAAINGEPIGVFAVSIRRSGKVVGVVSATALLRNLQTLIAPEAALTAGAVVTVMDENGIVVARSMAPDQWIGRALGVSSPASSRQRDGVREGLSPDGVERIGGYTTARRLPWLVYVGIPAGTALAPVRQRLTESLAVGGLMLCLGVGLAIFLGKRIADPLQRLSEDAERLGAGDLDHRSLVREGGEIGQLASALNQMSRSLADRTASLEASQYQLRQITDNLPVMISYLDRDQRFRFANSVYLDWLGQQPDSMLGRSLEEVYGTEAYARFRHQIEAGLQGRRIVYERDLAAVTGLRRVEVTLIPHASATGDTALGLFVLMRDVTEARAALAAQRLSEERLTLALESSATAFFDWDVVADRLYHSAQAAIMRGEPAREETAPSATLRESIHPDDRADVMARFKEVIAGRAPEYDAEFRVRHRGGAWIWLKAKGQVVRRDDAGRALRMTGTYADITARKADEERLRLLAEFDPLTGLPNRAQFHDRLTQAIARRAGSTKESALLFLDIDHFKDVNDTFGHEEGDRVLTGFAQVLRDSVRTSDTVARLGGDEFTIILEGLRGPEDAEMVAANVIDKVRRTLDKSGKRVTISASIGIAFITPEETDPAAVLRRADEALYQAKQGGRNRFAMSGHGELVPSGWTH